MQQAARLLETNDFENCHAAIAKAEHLLAQVRRGHWEQTAAAFPSPAASPCVAQFTTLPLHWTVAERLRKGLWGPNVQAAGDMESLDQMLKAGWQQQRLTSGRRSAPTSASRWPIRMPAARLCACKPRPADAKRRRKRSSDRPSGSRPAPFPCGKGSSSAFTAGSTCRGGSPASSDGLLVFDSLGGSDLGDRIRLTQGWREFTLYRAVPQTGELTVTFALTGLGEASHRRSLRLAARSRADPAAISSTDAACLRSRLRQLRADALAIWHAGLAAVRSDRLVRDNVRVDGDWLDRRR